MVTGLSSDKLSENGDQLYVRVTMSVSSPLPELLPYIVTTKFARADLKVVQAMSMQSNR